MTLTRGRQQRSPQRTRNRAQCNGMDEITIRSGRPGDARGIARLDVETWRATYAGILAAPFLVGLSMQRRELGWATVIEREPHDVRVAVNQDGHILGFGSCGRCRGEPEFAGEVFTLYVAPDWQNQGIGRRLLLALFERLVDPLLGGINAGDGDRLSVRAAAPQLADAAERDRDLVAALRAAAPAAASGPVF